MSICPFCQVRRIKCEDCDTEFCPVCESAQRPLVCDPCLNERFRQIAQDVIEPAIMIRPQTGSK